MKELNTVFKDKQEVSIKQKKQIEHELIGKIMPHSNHVVWEIDKDTLEIKKAEYSIATAIHFGDKPKNEIIVKPNCAYVSALNKKNALKQYRKGRNGTKEVWNEPMKF